MVDRELCEKMNALYLFFLFEKTSPGYYLPFVKSFYFFFIFFFPVLQQIFGHYVLLLAFSFSFFLVGVHFSCPTCRVL